MVFPKLIEVLRSAIQHLFKVGVPLPLFGVLLLCDSWRNHFPFPATLQSAID